MHDELDSGERRAQKLEVQFERILSEINNMPTRMELAIIKAINSHQDSCEKERKTKTPQVKVLGTPLFKTMVGIIAALVAAVGALLGTKI
jgi:hypothetical protein